MKDLWTVARVEIVLSLCRRVMWLVAGLMILLGWVAAHEVSAIPIDQWDSLGGTGVFVTLLLALTTGDQITRDRACRVDGVSKTPPVSPLAYVGGKYVAALVVLLGVSGLWLATALVVDHLAVAIYPPVGPGHYLAIWLWFVPVPVLFGAALGLAGITLAHRHRLLVPIAVVLIWGAPFFVAAPAHGEVISDLLDVTLLRSSSFSLVSPSIIGEQAPPNTDLLIGPHLHVTLPPNAGGPAAEMAMNYLPPVPAVCVWNRMLFLCLSLLLMCLTVWRAGKPRRASV